MTESQYNLVAVEQLAGEARLVVHMVCYRSRRDTPIKPMKLYGSEVDLNNGRFHSYDRTLTENSINVGRIRWDNLSQGFVNAVEWIAENCEGKWNFHLSYDENSAACHLTFYFDDLSDAVLFRLSIQHRGM